MWGYPYAVCACPVVLVGDLDLPLGVLAATTLVEVKAGNGGARPLQGVSRGFSYAQ